MHPMYEKANKALEDATVAMQTVLDTLGSSLLESIYQKCLAHELTLMGHRVTTEKQVEINYRGYTFKENLRADIIIDDCAILELKSVEGPIRKEFVAQLLSYMRLCDMPLGMILNFGATSSTRKKRLIAPGVIDENPCDCDF